jgi:hypothetical protein
MKLIRFHFSSQDYRDFLGIVPLDHAFPEHYKIEYLRVGTAKNKAGCRNIARGKRWKHAEFEKSPLERLRVILEAETESAALRERHKLEWEEHHRKFLPVKFRGYLKD